MSLGDVFTATAAVFRRRIGAFLALTGLQLLVGLVVLAIPLIAAVAMLIPTLTMGTQPSEETLVFIFLGVCGSGILAVLIAGIFTLYFDGMMIACANETIQGRFPSLSELRSVSKGYVGRIIGLYLLGMILAIVATGILIAPLFMALFGAMAAGLEGADISSSDAQMAIMGGFLISLLLSAIVCAAAFVLSVKLVYISQICAIERLSGIAALGRAWDITKGAFWRTFGYLIVFSFIAGAAQTALSTIVNVSMPSLVRNTASSGSAILDMLNNSTFIILVVGAFLLSMLVAMAIVPLRHAFVTVMYADQIQRDALGPVNHAFRMNFPANNSGTTQQPGAWGQAGNAAYPGQQQSQNGTPQSYSPYGSGQYGSVPGQQYPYGQQPNPGSYGQQPPGSQG